MPKKAGTSSRKQDHLRICAAGGVEAGFTGFSDVRLVHAALPECSLGEIDTEARFLGHRFASPLFIAAMTGGHPEALPINRNLAAAAQRCGIGMGVGSQRAALEDPDLEDSFAVVREAAPRAFLCANLGVVQLREHGIEWAERAVEMIDAQAICIHANFLQEAIMPEGDHDARGCLGALATLCRDFPVPVILMETGAGPAGQDGRPCLLEPAARKPFSIACPGEIRNGEGFTLPIHQVTQGLNTELEGLVFGDRSKGANSDGPAFRVHR